MLREWINMYCKASLTYEMPSRGSAPSRSTLCAAAVYERQYNSATVAYLCSNRAATQVKFLKTVARYSPRKIVFCRSFASSRNLRQPIALL